MTNRWPGAVLELRLAHHPDIEIVRQCGNGMEALEAIAELEPDLMFLDVQMPELDGFATLASASRPAACR